MNRKSSEVDQFIEMLQKYPPGKSVSNPWADRDHKYDEDEHSPRHRSNHLRAYLNERLDTAKALLIAEAPGYQGAKFSGIPMTCERTLLGYRPKIFQAPVIGESIKPQRTSRPSSAPSKAAAQWGFCEPTAAYIWPDLVDRGLSKKIVLWNIFAFDPYEDTNRLTNRPPSKNEIVKNQHILEAFLRLFPGRRILSIGNLSKEYLTKWDHRCKDFTRHPANRGGPVFRKNFREFLARVDPPS